MQLVIAEKPSVANSIADVLGANDRKDGYREGGRYIVSWCVGHLVELAQPDSYREEWKKWNYDTLPIIPDEWQYQVKADTKKQFDVVKKLMNDAKVSEVVCATDAGREGELIFRLVYEQAGCRKQIKRLWISSMEESAIRDGFNNLRPGNEYDNLYRSALCRQQADWLVGLNGTRLFTILYKSKILKVGRVQTPTLAMLVEREEAIRSFKKTPYYTVHLSGNGVDAVSEKYPNKTMAEELAGICTGKTVYVKSVVTEDKSIASPKLYDLTTLQRDANRIFSFTAKQTLEYTQSLYEKKLCTYPRTDSQYLSDDMEETAKSVLAMVEDIFPYLRNETTWVADFKRIMDSRKVTDHHAIIPTTQIKNLRNECLSEGETKVLSLLAARIVTATADKCQYQSVKAQMECEGAYFSALGRTIVSEGWKAFENAFHNQFKVKIDREDEEVNPLPKLTEGMIISPINVKVVEGFTKPPKHFTEDSLLLAMERAGAEDMDDEVERKGLGTPATRADIIEKLVKDGFVKRDKKQMIPTDDGIKLITVLPDVVKSPKLTADWENALTLVAKGEYSAEKFMAGIKEMITNLIKTYHEVGEENKNMFGSEEAIGRCPQCGGEIIRGKYGLYCSEKCGMNISRAFGKELTEEQVKDLLEGRKILVKGLKSKKGGTYAVYLTPEGVEPYNYMRKDGTEVNGFQYKFKREFPKKEGNENE
jgi:DNA topoisomerase-3